jgi:hypothetical protein
MPTALAQQRPSTEPDPPEPRAPRPASFAGPPVLETRFDGGGRKGRVTVHLVRTADRGLAGSGPNLAPPLPESARLEGSGAVGFPAVLARVEPESEGYWNWLGWIQLVNERDASGSSARAEHDPIWFLEGRDIPYGSVGYAPAFYDAPSRPERRAVLWEADLFLCTVPDTTSAGKKVDPPVAPLVGVRWGFRIGADGGEPVALAPRWTGDWAWASWVPVLREGFPGWRFADRTPSVALGPPRSL